MALIRHLQRQPAPTTAHKPRPANPETLKDLRPVVTEFVAMVITEATGWRAMLRDKNVPLG